MFSIKMSDLFKNIELFFSKKFKFWLVTVFCLNYYYIIIICVVLFQIEVINLHLTKTL